MSLSIFMVILSVKHFRTLAKTGNLIRKCYEHWRMVIYESYFTGGKTRNIHLCKEACKFVLYLLYRVDHSGCALGVDDIITKVVF